MRKSGMKKSRGLNHLPRTMMTTFHLSPKIQQQHPELTLLEMTIAKDFLSDFAGFTEETAEMIFGGVGFAR